MKKILSEQEKQAKKNLEIAAKGMGMSPSELSAMLQTMVLEEPQMSDDMKVESLRTYQNLT